MIDSCCSWCWWWHLSFISYTCQSAFLSSRRLLWTDHLADSNLVPTQKLVLGCTTAQTRDPKTTRGHLMPPAASCPPYGLFHFAREWIRSPVGEPVLAQEWTCPTDSVLAYGHRNYVIAFLWPTVLCNMEDGYTGRLCIWKSCYPLWREGFCVNSTSYQCLSLLLLNNI